MRRFAMPVVIAWTIAIAALLMAGPLYQLAGLLWDRRQYPAPGRLVRVGRRRRHVWECGAGPSVVLEAGIAGTSLGWRLVQDQLAESARVVAYDRAGLGWSDRVATPRTLDAAVEELRETLRAAAVSAPYTMVGHSYGGLIVQRYAVLYPDEVAGLVLLDPVATRDWVPCSDAQRTRLARGVRLSRRGAWLAQLGVVRLALTLLTAGVHFAPKWIARWSAGRGRVVAENLIVEVRKLPREVWPMVRMHWCEPKCFRTMASYLEYLPESVAAAAAEPVPARIPVVLMTPPNPRVEAQPGWIHHVASSSGHWVQLDEPQAVVDAVAQLLGTRPGPAAR